MASEKIDAAYVHLEKSLFPFIVRYIRSWFSAVSAPPAHFLSGGFRLSHWILQVYERPPWAIRFTNAYVLRAINTLSKGGLLECGRVLTDAVSELLSSASGCPLLSGCRYWLCIRICACFLCCICPRRHSLEVADWRLAFVYFWIHLRKNVDNFSIATTSSVTFGANSQLCNAYYGNVSS